MYDTIPKEIHILLCNYINSLLQINILYYSFDVILDNKEWTEYQVLHSTVLTHNTYYMSYLLCTILPTKPYLSDLRVNSGYGDTAHYSLKN